MAYWYIPSRGFVSDAEEGLQIPEYGSLQLPDGSLIEWGERGVYQVPEYTLREQFGTQPVAWTAQGLGTQDLQRDYATGYLPTLLDLLAQDRAGTLSAQDRSYYDQLVAEARAVPMREVSGLTYNAGQQTAATLHGGSPDLGAIMLSIADRIQAGTATDQERDLYRTTEQALREQDYRASVPQASDAFNPLGDNLFGALAVLGTGITGGLAAAPLLAGGAGLATTLGSLGTLAGTAGGWAGTLGGATGQEWMQTLGKALGAAGGIAGGLGGLSSLFSSGVTSLADAARLASGAGKITGALGTATGSPALRQAAGYLSTAGNVGRLGSGVSGLLGAADVATQRGGGPMADWYDWEYTDPQAASYDNWSWNAGATSPDYFQSDAYKAFTGWGDPYGPGSSGDPAFSGEGGSTWLSTLASLAGGAGKFLGSNASWLGPAASTLGSLGAGAIGSNASSDAARLQAAALNRGLSLQEAQWLENVARQAPWVEAGRNALGELTWRQGVETSPAIPGATAAISGANYALPGTTPGWTPQTIDAQAYRWTPGQGPRAADYRYTPGAIPAASQYRYTPGAVPTLSGAELLANDPGVQFRLDEGRKALEASAAARGGLTSGATLSALQRQAQELSSQEYANAWNRASQQAQLREQWGQAASTLGFGQAMDETRLREQVNQIAAQQGWSQAQAEAAFREQMAQQASQQGFTQQLAGQQWNVGQQQRYETDLYQRLMQANQIQYGRDVYGNETQYARDQQAYNQQIAEMTRQFNQAASLAGLGQTSVGQLGTIGQSNATQLGSLLSQLGTAQGLGELGPALAWQKSIGGATNNLTSLLAGLNR